MSSEPNEETARLASAQFEAQLARAPAAAAPPTPAASREWRTLHVFVSSTFVDMREERRVLNVEVFPQLEQQLRARRVRLQVTDLSWGIPSASTAAETIAFCREELGLAHVFLYLGGQRFGWVPDARPEAAQVPAEARASWLPGMSITAMEVVEGALRRSGRGGLFFLRDARYVAALPQEAARDFVSVGGDDIRQRALHAILRRSFHSAVRDYWPRRASAQLGSSGAADDAPSIASWADFASAALSDLTALANSALPPAAAAVEAEGEGWGETGSPSGAVDPRAARALLMEAERFQHLDAANLLLERAAPRPEVLASVVNALLAPASAPSRTASAAAAAARGIVVISPPGQGKSTLLAAAASELVKRLGDGRVFMHGVGSGEGSDRLDAFCARLAAALATLAGMRAYSPPTKAAAAAAACAHFLKTVGADSTADASPLLTIVVDDADAFSGSAQPIFSWLPATASPAFCFLLSLRNSAVAAELTGASVENYDVGSADVGPASSTDRPPSVAIPASVVVPVAAARALALARSVEPARPNLRLFEVPALGAGEQRAVLAAALSQLHKRLDPANAELLLAKAGSANPSFVVAAVNVLRRRAIHDNMRQTVDALPASFTALLSEELGRIAQPIELGAQCLLALALALTASPFGLLEAELLHILPAIERALHDRIVGGALSLPAKAGAGAGANASSVGGEELMDRARWNRLRSKCDFVLTPSGGRGLVRCANQATREAMLEAALQAFAPAGGGPTGWRATDLLPFAHRAIADFFASPAADAERRCSGLMPNLAALHDAEGLCRALCRRDVLAFLFDERQVPAARLEFIAHARSLDTAGEHAVAASAFSAEATALLVCSAGNEPTPERLSRLEHALLLCRALLELGAPLLASQALEPLVETSRKALELAAAAGVPVLEWANLHANVLRRAAESAVALGDFNSALGYIDDAADLVARRKEAAASAASVPFAAAEAATERRALLVRSQCFVATARFAEARAALKPLLGGLSAREAAAAGGDEGKGEGMREADAEAPALLEALGDIDAAEGRHAAAYTHFEAAAAAQVALGGALDPAASMLALKVALSDIALGRFVPARALLERVLGAQQRALGPAHLDVAATLNAQGRLEAAQGRTLSALVLFRRSLDVQRASAGELSVGMASTLSNIGAALVGLRRYGDSLRYFTRSLRIFAACLGVEHPDTASVIVNVALAYEKNGRLGDAIHCLRHALRVRVRTFGAQHALSLELQAAIDGLVRRAFVEGSKKQASGRKTLMKGMAV